jgi:hypothetical protein
VIGVRSFRHSISETNGGHLGKSCPSLTSPEHNITLNGTTYPSVSMGLDQDRVLLQRDNTIRVTVGPWRLAVCLVQVVENSPHHVDMLCLCATNYGLSTVLFMSIIGAKGWLSTTSSRHGGHVVDCKRSELLRICPCVVDSLYHGRSTSHVWVAPALYDSLWGM